MTLLFMVDLEDASYISYTWISHLPFIAGQHIFAEVIDASNLVDIVFVRRDVWTAPDRTQYRSEFGRDRVQRVNHTTACLDGRDNGIAIDLQTHQMYRTPQFRML